MAFKLKRGLLGNSSPVLRKVIIDNSDDIAIGDAVKVYNAGDAEKLTAGKPIFGIVHAIVDQYGRSILPQQHTQAEVGDWTVASEVITVGSDNETDDKVAVICDVSLDTIYSGDVTGTIGTTVSSNKPGASIDVDDEDSLDETSATRTGSAQFFSWGTDPDDSGNLLVSIKESERTGTLSY